MRITLVKRKVGKPEMLTYLICFYSYKMDQHFIVKFFFVLVVSVAFFLT